MIEVKVRYLPQPKDQWEEIEVELANISADGMADAIRKDIQVLKCGDHPNSISVITVVADMNYKHKLEKTKFCCEKFKDSIDVQVD